MNVTMQLHVSNILVLNLGFAFGVGASVLTRAAQKTGFLLETINVLGI